jgi:16S rRNA pseudouridine516 synthase
MRLADLLFSQGFGTRREAAALVALGRVRIGGRASLDPAAPVDLAEGDPFEVDGTAWPFHAQAVVMLHKPAGTECSARPGAWPGVSTLLPAPLRQRGVQPVGRLDADTTGLLLLTDDGALNHRLTSPRHAVEKMYEVGCVHAVTPDLVQRLLAGVVLRDEPGAPARALACEATGASSLRLVIAEGRYHQVKRMVAAAGNRVATLHRSAFGPLVLPADLAPGSWRFVTAEALAALRTPGAVRRG